MGDVHDFVLDDFSSVSNAQLFGAEHMSHIDDCLHDLLIFTINKYQKSEYYSNKNIQCRYILDLLQEINNKPTIN